MGIDALEVFDFVLLADAMDFLEHGQFRLIGRDDNLAAHVVGDIVFLAKLHEFAPPLHAVGGFQGPGLVVQPRVNDPRVVARLVVRKPRHLVDQHHAALRKTLLKLVERGRTDNAAAHHHHIVLSV